MPWVLETLELSKAFGGIKAVDRLVLSIRRGGMTSIVGPNGSGKSTLLNIVTGMLPFDKGTVVLNGTGCKVILPVEISSFGLTRTFQEVRLFRQMTVIDNVLLALSSRGAFPSIFERTSSRSRKKALQILDIVGLANKQGALAGTLSFGQSRLLEIGRALAMNVDTFLMDEPFSGLSPKMLDVVLSILFGLKREGRTIIFVSHNMEIVRELSDHVIVMSNGSLVAEGSPEEVLALPHVVKAYLGS